MPGPMLPAATTKGGLCMTPGPIDVCKVPAPPAPPIPMPFPNLGMIQNALSTTTTVMFENKFVVVEMSDSDGDNFTKNLITLRAERRLALATEKPAAVRGGDLTPA